MEKTKRTINIAITTTHLWLATFVLIVGLAGTIFGAIFSVKDAYDQVNKNQEVLINHEDRLKKVEDSINDFDSSVQSIKDLKQTLEDFRKELINTRDEWTKLYRDFDLRKK